MGEQVIVLTDLTKQYGNFTAVDHIRLHIQKGEIFGLLGPNGAGKSTTILMMLGLTDLRHQFDYTPYRSKKKNRLFARRCRIL